MAKTATQIAQEQVDARLEAARKSFNAAQAASDRAIREADEAKIEAAAARAAANTAKNEADLQKRGVGVGANGLPRKAGEGPEYKAALEKATKAEADAKAAETRREIKENRAVSEKASADVARKSIEAVDTTALDKARKADKTEANKYWDQAAVAAAIAIAGGTTAKSAVAIAKNLKDSIATLEKNIPLAEQKGKVGVEARRAIAATVNTLQTNGSLNALYKARRYAGYAGVAGIVGAATYGGAELAKANGFENVEYALRIVNQGELYAAGLLAGGAALSALQKSAATDAQLTTKAVAEATLKDANKTSSKIDKLAKQSASVKAAQANVVAADAKAAKALKDAEAIKKEAAKVAKKAEIEARAKVEAEAKAKKAADRAAKMRKNAKVDAYVDGVKQGRQLAKVDQIDANRKAGAKAAVAGKNVAKGIDIQKQAIAQARKDAGTKQQIKTVAGKEAVAADRAAKAAEKASATRVQGKINAAVANTHQAYADASKAAQQKLTRSEAQQARRARELADGTRNPQTGSKIPASAAMPGTQAALGAAKAEASLAQKTAELGAKLVKGGGRAAAVGGLAIALSAAASVGANAATAAYQKLRTDPYVRKDGRVYADGRRLGRN